MNPGEDRPPKSPARKGDSVQIPGDYQHRALTEGPRIILRRSRPGQSRRVRKRQRSGVRIDRLLHPSPASPVANRGWAPQAKKQLKKMGLL